MPIPKTFTMLGTSEIDVLVCAEESGGALSVITEGCGPGGGPPPHTHTNEDEFLMPIDGDYDYFDGKPWRAMRSHGEFTKRGNVHTWRKGPGGHGRLLVVTTPGGFENFMFALRDVRLPDGAAELMTVSKDYGIRYPKMI